MRPTALPDVSVVGRDRQPILTLDDWFAHAPPAGGRKQWVNGYSAKEQAKAWMRTKSPTAPLEILAALRNADIDDLQSLTAYPEHETPLDRLARGGKGNRNHDLLAIAARAGGETVVIGIEAKACEGFDGIVGTRAAFPLPADSRTVRISCPRALFGRDVCDANTGAVLDPDLATHGYRCGPRPSARLSKPPSATLRSPS